jgi:hypothetical protein
MDIFSFSVVALFDTLVAFFSVVALCGVLVVVVCFKQLVISVVVSLLSDEQLTWIGRRRRDEGAVDC